MKSSRDKDAPQKTEAYNSEQRYLLISHPEVGSDIELSDIILLYWKNKMAIATIFTIAAIASVIYSLQIPNIYRSDMLVATNFDTATNAVSAVVGQINGLANLAGLNLDAGQEDRANSVLEILKSKKFTTYFINKHALKPDLLAVERWNPENNALSYVEKLYDRKNDKWIRDVTPPKAQIPSDNEAYKAFSRIIRISRKDVSGLIRISIDHKSPIIAQQWLTWLTEDINEYLRDMDTAESEYTISSLENMLADTSVSSIRSAISQLIEEHKHSLLLTKAKADYALKVIDPPLIPEEKHSPKRALLCILGSLIGLFAAIIYVHITNLISKSMRQDIDN